MVSDEWKKKRDNLLRYRKALDFITWLESKKEKLTDSEEIQELEQRIENKRRSAETLRTELLNQLERLDNLVQVEILELHFIEGLTIPEISERLMYSNRHVARVYSNAIKTLVTLDN